MNLKNFLRIGAFASLSLSMAFMLSLGIAVLDAGESKTNPTNTIKALLSIELIFAAAAIVFSIAVVANNVMDGESDWGILVFALIGCVAVIALAHASVGLDAFVKEESGGTSSVSSAKFYAYGTYAIPFVSFFLIPLPAVYTAKEW